MTAATKTVTTTTTDDGVHNFSNGLEEITFHFLPTNSLLLAKVELGAFYESATGY